VGNKGGEAVSDITLPRAVIEQVREAFKELDYASEPYVNEIARTALAALDAALAEPEHIHTCGPDCQKPPCVNRRREIAAAVEAEREACLKAAEQAKMHQMVWYPKGYTIDANKVNEMYTAQHVRCVEAIRARGSK